MKEIGKMLTLYSAGVSAASPSLSSPSPSSSSSVSSFFKKEYHEWLVWFQFIDRTPNGWMKCLINTTKKGFHVVTKFIEWKIVVFLQFYTIYETHFAFVFFIIFALLHFLWRRFVRRWTSPASSCGRPPCKIQKVLAHKPLYLPLLVKIVFI